MPPFRYQTLDHAAGASVIDAPDRATALRELRRRGITPTRIEPASGTSLPAAAAAPAAGPRLEFEPAQRRGLTPAAAGPSAPVKGHMSGVQMASFMRELATAVQAGLPLVQSLQIIRRQVRQPGQKAILDRLLHDVEHGKSLSEAEAACGKPFTELTISLTRAAEASGKMGELLEQTANLLDRDLKLRRTLLQGLMYPAVLSVLIVVAVGVMVGFIVPGILKPFAGKVTADQLPVPTRIVMALGDAVTGYWWVMALLVAGALLAFQQAWRTPASRLTIDRFLLSVPLLGRVLRDVAVARFTRTLGTLVTAGLPALTALKVTKGTLGNKAMERVIEEVCDQVASGKTISEPMERSGYFPGLLTQIVGLGEKSGRLPQMLNQAATVFEDRTEAVLKTVPGLINMLLVLLAACVIGFVMAGVLLPMIQMQELMSR
jgi:type II secretory pathway component PulF